MRNKRLTLTGFVGLVLGVIAIIVGVMLNNAGQSEAPTPPTALPTRSPRPQPSPTSETSGASIFDLQRTSDPDGRSQFEGQTVTTRGLVTAVFDGGERVFIQDPAGGPWSGLFLFRPTPIPSVGDEIEVTGPVQEFKGLTEIDSGTLTILSQNNPLPAPHPVASGDAAQEQWESVLLRIDKVSIADPDVGHGEWQVDDGSGVLLVDDLGSYGYRPAAGDSLGFVIGPLNYSFGAFKLEPRTDADIDVLVQRPPEEVLVCAIQGDGLSSPFEGHIVITRGVVTADLESSDRQGFFIQAQDCDGNPATSDGIFVYDRGQDLVSKGDAVMVQGQVKEFFGLTEIVPDDVEISSTFNPLPQAVKLDPPADPAQSQQYFESLEGMLVQARSTRVVGPTNRFGEFAVVTDNAVRGRHVFEDGPVNEIFMVDDAGIGPFDLQVGDLAAALEGPLDYSFGHYKLQLITGPTVMKSPDPTKPGDLDGDRDIDLNDRQILETRLGERATDTADPGDLNRDRQITDADLTAWDDLFAELTLAPTHYTVATFNVENLFDDVVDRGKTQTRDASSLLNAEELELKLDKLAEAIHDELREPTILGLQEVEKIELLEALAARSELETSYGSLLIEGPDGRGIDVGLMYDRNRVSVVESRPLQGCTTLSPDTGGSGVPCDSDGDGTTDGNQLFGRPPLMSKLIVTEAGSQAQSTELWVIVAHFKSKRGGVALTEPRRVEQARFLTGVVNDLLAENPDTRVMVLGDLNDGLSSATINTLTSESPLGHLWSEVPEEERYSFIFNGAAGVLDYVLITPALVNAFESFEPIHINADFPESWSQVPDIGRRSSDHDPLLAQFRLK